MTRAVDYFVLVERTDEQLQDTVQMLINSYSEKGTWEFPGPASASFFPADNDGPRDGYWHQTLIFRFAKKDDAQ